MRHTAFFGALVVALKNRITVGRTSHLFVNMHSRPRCLRSCVGALNENQSHDPQATKATDVSCDRQKSTPDAWRKVRIKDYVEDVGNYRPICPLPALYKLFTTIL